MGDVEIWVAGGFADDGEAGFLGGGDVFGSDLDEEAAGMTGNRDDDEDDEDDEAAAGGGA